MDNPGDLMHLCRLCLVKDQVNIPIFEEHGDIRQIFVKISSCLPVKVSKDDQLPKRICDGCSNKLDLLYEFCNTSANSEKKLLSWLEQAGLKDVDTISAVAQHTAKPLETQTQVKQEALEDIHAAVQQTDHLELTDEGVGAAVFEENAIDESDEPPPPKRARRTAAVKAQINITPDSDDDDDDMDISEPMTKVEDESDDSDVDKDPSYVDVPGTSADDQPGPSGVGKDGVEAPIVKVEIKEEKFDDDFDPLNKPSGKEKSCPVCSKVLKNNWYLKKHMLTHSEDRPHPCPKCNKKFKTSYQLKTHDVRMHGELQYFECDFCSAKLRSKGSWMIHRRRHLKEYVVKCEMCNMGFVTNQEYINHMGSKHGAGGHMCNICGRTCYDKAALQSHMARHAEGYNENTNIRCEICNKTFLQERYLRHHFQRIHLNGGQRFICDLCGKKVNSKRSLRDHMYIHQGIKPLACKECGKSFGLRTTLKLHIRTHTGQRPYHCTVCGKSFTQRSPLTVHMRHHTGEKPYECDICHNKFVSKACLNSHVKKSHSTIS